MKSYGVLGTLCQDVLFSYVTQKLSEVVKRLVACAACRTGPHLGWNKADRFSTFFEKTTGDIKKSCVHMRKKLC